MAMIDVYKCNKCGAVYPDDYYEEYGRKYGKGLGRPPVCEALSSKYDRPLKSNINAPEKTMFPICNCRGTMSLSTIDDKDYTPLVLADEDKGYHIRGPSMQMIQAAKSAELTTHLKTVVASFKKTGRPVPSHLLKM